MYVSFSHTHTPDRGLQIVLTAFFSNSWYADLNANKTGLNKEVKTSITRSSYILHVSNKFSYFLVNKYAGL